MDSRLLNLLHDKGSTIHSISPSTSIYECAKKMTECHVGALLVIQQETLIGIISERDIARKLTNYHGNISEATVADMMTKHLITVSPSMSVTEAMRLVTDKRCRHLPVIDNNKLVGLISIGDLTRWVMLAQEHEIYSLTNYIQGNH